MIKFFLAEPADPGIRLTFERKTPGSSGYDLHANSCERLLPAGRRMAFRTGLHIAMPLGVEAQIRPRSGLARDHGVMAAFGSVDSDYRGTIVVTLFNFSETDYKVLAGERIAQLVFAPVLVPGMEPDMFPTVASFTDNGQRVIRSQRLEPMQVATLADLGETERGASGHGSSGRV